MLSEGSRVRGVLREGNRSLEGTEAFLKLRPLLGGAEDLARLSMLFLEVGVAGASPVKEPPRLQGDELLYWRLAAQRADLERVTVNIREGRVVAVQTEAELAEGDPFVAALLQLQDPENVDACRAGISALLALSDPRGYPVIIEQALHAPMPGVRSAAVEALAGSPIPGRIEVLGQVLRADSRPKIRYEAAVQLYRLQDPLARPALTAAAKEDPDPGVRQMAASALVALDAR